MLKPSRQQIICTKPQKRPRVNWFDINYKIIVGGEEYFREYSCQEDTPDRAKENLKALIRFDEIDQFIILSVKKRK